MRRAKGLMSFTGAEPNPWPFDASAAVVASLAICSFLTLLLPWAAAGSTSRSAFALASALTSAGLLTGIWDRLLDFAVAAIPIAVGLACASALLGLRRVAATFATLVGAIVVAAGVVVVELRVTSGIGSGFGIAVGSTAMLACPVWGFRKEGLHVRGS